MCRQSMPEAGSSAAVRSTNMNMIIRALMISTIMLTCGCGIGSKYRTLQDLSLSDGATIRVLAENQWEQSQPIYVTLLGSTTINFVGSTLKPLKQFRFKAIEAPELGQVGIIEESQPNIILAMYDTRRGVIVSSTTFDYSNPTEIDMLLTIYSKEICNTNVVFSWNVGGWML